MLHKIKYDTRIYKTAKNTQSMRILIGARSQRMKFHWVEFARHLSACGDQYKVVNAVDFAGFPSKRVHKWIPSSRRFNTMVGDFKPDVILTDELRHFGLMALKSGVPLVVALHGDVWSEIQNGSPNPVQVISPKHGHWQE